MSPPSPARSGLWLTAYLSLALAPIWAFLTAWGHPLGNTSVDLRGHAWVMWSVAQGQWPHT